MPLAPEKELYRTLDAIRKKLDRGGVDSSGEEDLWKSLDLTESELLDVLSEVTQRATEPFVLPMFTRVASTGARRSEIVRIMMNDFVFEAGTVTIRGTNGRGRHRVVSRQVQLHPRLRDTMKQWFARHPGGQFALCQAYGSPLTRDAATHHIKATLKGTKWSVIEGFHVFRHSLCSNLASKAVDQRIFDSFVGHQTDEMRERYPHLHSTTQRDAIERGAVRRADEVPGPVQVQVGGGGGGRSLARRHPHTDPRPRRGIVPRPGRRPRHQREEARRGPEGIEAARRDRPDVILLDIGLPTLDG